VLYIPCNNEVFGVAASFAMLSCQCHLFLVEGSCVCGLAISSFAKRKWKARTSRYIYSGCKIHNRRPGYVVALCGSVCFTVAAISYQFYEEHKGTFTYACFARLIVHFAVDKCVRLMLQHNFIGFRMQCFS
jgi:hypothetical protein